MIINISGVHYSVSETTKEFIHSKLECVHHEDCIQDISFKIEQNSDESFDLKLDLHFKWGEKDHFHVQRETVLYKGIEKIVEKLVKCVRRSSEKHMRVHQKGDSHHGVQMAKMED